MISVPWFERMNFVRSYSSLPSLPSTTIFSASTSTTCPRCRRGDVARVDGRAVLEPGADERRLRDHQRHRLALHVRAHQRAVGVVVLEERDQRRPDRDDLRGRHVHVLDVLRVGRDGLPSARAAEDVVVHEFAGLVVDALRGLRDRVLRLLGGVEI